MGAVGRVRQHVERRQRSGSNLTIADLQWFLVNFVLYVVGLALAPVTGLVREMVVQWVWYVTPWVGFVASTEHLLARWRRSRESADAGKPEPPQRAWVSAMFFGGVLLITELTLYTRASEGRLFALLAVVIVAIAFALWIEGRARRRRDAARGELEVAALARKF
jgi:hypothetical protein